MMKNNFLGFLGSVKLIWEDGFEMNKPIGSQIRGVLRCGERYSRYEMYYSYSDYSVKDLTDAEMGKLNYWLDLLRVGAKRRDEVSVDKK